MCAYPAYVPEILDVVTMDDVVEDMAIRKFAERTDLYGTSGTFDDPQHIAPTDRGSVDSLARRALALEPGLQAVVLSRHLDHSLSAGSVQLSLRHARPIELSPQSINARHFRL